MNSRIALLVEMTKNEYDGQPFNGPSLKKTLGEFTLDQVKTTNTVENYSVWGIVMHLLYWQYFLTQGIGGDVGAFPYEDKDWPAIPDGGTGEAWQQTLQYQDQLHADYIQALEAFPADKLEDVFDEWKCSFLQAVSWMATHDLYHAAQIRNMGIGA